MKKIFFLSATFVALTSLCFAQTKGLKVGTQMPAYKFPKVLNWNKPSIDLKEFRGKYVILDMWATSCASCIKAFPKMQKINDQFKDKLQIVLVNVWDADTKEAVSKVLERFKLKLGTTISLPVSLNDEVLNSYFPRHRIPHEIIIDPKGKILAITSGWDITSEKIGTLISGKHIDFPLKDDFWDYNLPISSSPTVLGNELLVNSTLTRGYFLGFYRGIKTNKKKEQIGAIETSVPLLYLYRMAYPEFINYDLQTIFETKDPVFQNTEDDPTKWFSYDLIVPPGTFTKEKYTKYLKQDLNRVFSFSFRKEKRPFPCLVIKSNSKISDIYAKQDNIIVNKNDHGQLAMALWKDEGNLGYWKEADRKNIPIYIKQKTLSTFISEIKLDTRAFDDVGLVKIIDESGMNVDKMINLQFPVNFDFDNREKLIVFLHDKGIDLNIENRELDCMIVSDKKPGEPTVLSSK